MLSNIQLVMESCLAVERLITNLLPISGWLLEHPMVLFFLTI